MMYAIQIQRDQHGADLARWDIHDSHQRGTEVDSSTALTIASWWQSPGPTGRELAAFASGARVTTEALLDDIHATRVVEGYFDGRMSDDDKLALDMLSTFIINYA
jgi:hypothetical protein